MRIYDKHDWLIALAAILIILFLGACSLTVGLPFWGDDSAAYINEGISIADGSFKQQIELNYYYHPTDIPDEASDKGYIVYVWGYPLILSVIFKLFGFNFNNIVLYKLPSLLCLSLTAGVLVLFFRRRFSIALSFVISLLFCLSADVFISINYLYSDLVFLFFTCFAFLLMEWLSDISDKEKHSWLIALLYSLTLWMTYETRLSGFAVVVVAFLGHSIDFAINGSKNRKFFLLNFSPYFFTGIMILITERLILAPATQNISDMSTKFDRSVNVFYYYKLFGNYFDRIAGAGIIVFVLFLIGFVTSGFKRQNIYLTLFVVGTMIVNVNLPYIQGMRYIFNILPFVLMYAGYGLSLLAVLTFKLFKNFESKGTVKPFDKMKESTIKKAVLICFSAFVIAFSCVYPVRVVINNITHWGEKKETDVYSSNALDVYQYIMDNTSEDCVIAFYKPRSLYLNTKRKSFRLGVNGHVIDEADYYLRYKLAALNSNDDNMEITNGDIVYDNSAFTLYRLR